MYNFVSILSILMVSNSSFIRENDFFSTFSTIDMEIGKYTYNIFIRIVCNVLTW